MRGTKLRSILITFLTLLIFFGFFSASSADILCYQNYDAIDLSFNGSKISEALMFLISEDPNSGRFTVHSLCLNGVCMSDFFSGDVSQVYFSEVHDKEAIAEVQKIVAETQENINPDYVYNNKGRSVPSPKNFHFKIDLEAVKIVNESEPLLATISESQLYPFPDINKIHNKYPDQMDAFEELCAYQRILSYDLFTHELKAYNGPDLFDENYNPYTSNEVYRKMLGSETKTKDQAKIKSIKGPLLNNLTGQILLRVEENGEAYYINPVNQNIFYLGRPADAFRVMREQGLGITNSNLAKIPIAVPTLKGQDSDGDGLSDDFELALGLDPHKQDSDGDGHLDMIELANAYNPLGPGRLKYDLNFAKQQAGKILLQVEGRGEAWYLSPKDNKRYFLGRPADAFAVMRSLGLGVANSNFSQIMKFD